MDPTQSRKRPLYQNRQASSQAAAPVKRRASQACLSCRNRKVRCDVTSAGMPCTNCKLDDCLCEVKETQRGRRPSSAQRSERDGAAPRRAAHGGGLRENRRPQEQRVTAETEWRMPTTMEDEEMEEDAADAEESDDGSVIDCQPSTTPSAQQRAPPEAADPVSSNVDAEMSEELEGNVSRLHSPPLSPPHLVAHQPSYQSPLQQQPEPPRPRTFQSLHQPPPFHYDQADHTSGGLPRNDNSRQLPRYIKPLPKHLDSQDLEYMVSKRCLEIPDNELRDELLRVFISVVYPLIPIIDVEETLDAVVANNGRNPISLLLFQSIMFVSVAFVDVEYLLSRGYSSHNAARKDFFNRVRILYSLNYEKDRIALTQSLLAVTYWYDAPDDDKDTWYWMGVALTTAQVAGFHREPAASDNAQQQRVARLQRRIWWSCFMRDLFLALGLRRPPRIRDSDYAVSMLCAADFDVSPPSATMQSFFRGSKFPCPDQASKREMAMTSIALSQLCLTVGQMLQAQYTSVGAYYGGSEYLGPVKPKRTNAQISTLAKCATELSDWIQKQNARVLYVPGDEPSLPQEATANRKEDITRFHRIQLHMLYLAALAALRRPSVFCQGTASKNTEEQGSLPPHIALDPAIEMIKLAFDLQRNDQLRYLTTTAVPAFLWTSLVHLLDARQGDEKDRNLSLGRLYQAVYVLQALRSIYSAADYALSFLRSILANTKIRIPLLWLDNGSNTQEGETSVSKVSMDMRPNEVAAACMYPSPSASVPAKPTEASPSSETTTIPTDMNQWELPWDGELYGEVPALHELVSASPFFSGWGELDAGTTVPFDMGSNGPSFLDGASMSYQ